MKKRLLCIALILAVALGGCSLVQESSGAAVDLVGAMGALTTLLATVAVPIASLMISACREKERDRLNAQRQAESERNLLIREKEILEKQRMLDVANDTRIRLIDNMTDLASAALAYVADENEENRRRVLQICIMFSALCQDDRITNLAENIKGDMGVEPLDAFGHHISGLAEAIGEYVWRTAKEPTKPE